MSSRVGGPDRPHLAPNNRNNRKNKDPDMKEQRAGYERQWAPTMTGSDWKYPLC